MELSDFNDMAQHCVTTEGVRYAWILLDKDDIISILTESL